MKNLSRSILTNLNEQTSSQIKKQKGTTNYIKDDILKMLNKRLDEVMKETNKTISYCRELVLEEFKNKGIIKNYNYTNNFNPLVNSQKEGYEHCLYFGSKAGFDNMYYVSF